MVNHPNRSKAAKAAAAPPQLTIEEKIVFAVSPDGTGDGAPLVLMGVTKGAWEYMQGGKTHTFDLTKAGVPIKLVLFGAGTHDDAMREINAILSSQATAYLDKRRDDFAIGDKAP